MKFNTKNLTIVVSTILLIIICSLIEIINPGNILNSPDETSNYVVMKAYSASGQMYLHNKYLELDQDNLLHQRGFLTWENKTVAFNYLGFPFYMGPQYLIFEKHISLIIKIIYIILILILVAKLYQLFYGERKTWLTSLSIIFLTPILFYINFFYYNIMPNIIFFLLFIFYLFKFNKTHSSIDLYLSVFFSCVSIFFRYEIIIFVLLVFILNISLQFRSYFGFRKSTRHLIILSLIAISTFIIPLLIINNDTYGHPLTYGYSIFNKVYFPDDRANSALSSVRSMLFPSQDFNALVFSTNIKVILFLISPIFFILAYLGILYKETYTKIGLYFFIFIYFLFYNGMNPNTYLSGSSTATLSTAVVRYWLIAFPLLLIPFCYFVNKGIKNKKFTITVMAFLLIYSVIFFIALDPNSSMLKYKDQFNSYKINIEKISNFTKTTDYLISSTNGKIYYNNINIISWWGGPSQSESDKFFNATKLAKISKILISYNHSVYYLSDKYNAHYIPLIENENMTLDATGFQGLYKLRDGNEK